MVDLELIASFLAKFVKNYKATVYIWLSIAYNMKFTSPAPGDRVAQYSRVSNNQNDQIIKMIK